MWLRARCLVNAARDLPRQSLLKLVVVGLMGTGFWLGVFFASLAGFRFVHSFLGDARLLVETLLSSFFLLLLVMLFFSTAIISFGSLYRSDETRLLLSWPMRAGAVYLYKLIESLTFSSWAFMVLGLPLMLGYGVSVGLRWHYLLWLVAYFVPFVALAAGAGSLAALAVARWVPKGAKRLLGWIVVVGLVLGLWALVWVHGEFRAGALYLQSWLPRVLGRLNVSRNLFLPSYWVARGLIAAARGEVWDGLYFFLVLTSNAALVLVVCHEAGARLLRVSWSRARSLAGARGRMARGRWVLARWAPAARLLIGKDWRTFVRDPVQWSQCAILFGLMGFYVVNLRTFSYHVAQQVWRNLTALLNLAATSLVLATVTTRFVFPLLSLEGRRFWFLGLAPVRRGTLLWSKFLFSFVAALGVTFPLVFISDYMLDLPATTIWHHVVALVVVCFGVSGLSVGLGAVFPNLREENPAKIVSGFGGTLNLVLSVFFVAAVLVLTAAPYGLRLARRGSWGPETAWALGATVVVGLVAGLVPMAQGLRSLRRLEF